ncbi:MAG: Xaa-Pro peptidase family protein [Thaumarchaeota archaeon]|nr:Xaa-Pro peptidase family protein [Nitrososphaerota archaeon]
MQAAGYRFRVQKLKKRLGEEGLQGAVMVPGPNLRYYTGGNSILLERPFLLFVSKEGEAHMVAPELEAGPYRHSPIPIRIHPWTDNEGPGKAFKELTSTLELGGMWGVEGRAPYLFVYHLQKHARVKLANGEPVLQGVRETKDEEEIRLMRRSGEILSRVFKKIPSLLKVGMSELELARRLGDETLAQGAEAVSDLLVQSGERGADPHSLPSRRKLKKGESVVVDISTSFSGYVADITRTFVLGASQELENTYAKVLEAEERAIKQARTGVTVGSVDAAARGFLKRYGLDRYFIHRTGHGLGLEVHEAPYIVSGGREVLREDMFFTIEPGVYVPGKSGVRIEDDVMSTKGGRDVITNPPKEYGWWN